MERVLSLALILLLLLTGCGVQKSSGEDGPDPAAEATAAQSEPAETVEEITAVSVPDTQEPPAAEAPTQPEPPAETTAAEIPTSRTGTMITGTFIVKDVQGTLLTLYMYDAAKGGELKSGAFTADYGGLNGADQMCFSIGDIVTIRYDQEIAETYPMQLTVREICPAAWNN